MDPMTNDQYLARDPPPSPHPSPSPSGSFILQTVTPDETLSPSTTSSSSTTYLTPAYNPKARTKVHTQPLHRRASPFSLLLHRLNRSLLADLDTTSYHLDTTLLLLTLSSTLERWTTKSAFGFQIFGLTGNLTELLSPLPYSPSSHFRPSLLACVVAWCGALLLTSQIANRLHAKTKRWWILLSLILQLVLVVAGALLPDHYHFYADKHPEEQETPSHTLKVALLAASSGWTWVMIKQLGVTEINAALMTGVVGNLLAHERLFVWPIEWRCAKGVRGALVGRDRGRLRYMACAAIFMAGYKIAGVTGGALEREEGEGGGRCWEWRIVVLIRALAFVSFWFVGDKEVQTVMVVEMA